MTVAFLPIEQSFSSAMLLAEPFRECNEHELRAEANNKSTVFFFSVNFFFNNQTSYYSTAQIFVFRKRNKEEMTSEAKNL